MVCVEFCGSLVVNVDFIDTVRTAAIADKLTLFQVVIIGTWQGLTAENMSRRPSYNVAYNTVT